MTDLNFIQNSELYFQHSGVKIQERAKTRRPLVVYFPISFSKSLECVSKFMLDASFRMCVRFAAQRFSKNVFINLTLQMCVGGATTYL